MSTPVRKAKDNRLSLSWAIMGIDKISEFLINLWELSPENRQKMRRELEDLLTSELNKDFRTKRSKDRLIAYKKSFDYNVQYEIESTWEIDAPRYIDAPVQVTGSFDEAREILFEKKSPIEPTPSQISLDNTFTIGDLFAVGIKASVSEMEVTDGAY